MIPPTATEHWPRLSVSLKFERHPFICQSCGFDGRSVKPKSYPLGTQENPEPEQCGLRRWREHDQQDKPQDIIVVLCKPCSETLIDPHPRLYDCIGMWAPALGAMRVCVDCMFRQGLHCSHPDTKENNPRGNGLVLKMPTPSRGFVDGRDKNGRSFGGPRVFWSGPVTCTGQRLAGFDPAIGESKTVVTFPDGSSMAVDACRSCSKAVVWLRTTKGKMMPVDAESVKTKPELYDPEAGHVSHFTTCPDAKKWSKKKPKVAK